MEFGILFTSHPNTEAEPYPHRDVHARVTQQIVRADELGYDYAWVAEHHFSNEYGIMPDVFVYAGYLAALTKRIKIGTAVVTLPLANPLAGRREHRLRRYFEQWPFRARSWLRLPQIRIRRLRRRLRGKRRDIQEEALPLLDGAVPQQARRPSRRSFQFQGRRPLRAVSARAATAASADLSGRRHRALDRRRGPHGLWSVPVELDAVFRTGAADRELPRALDETPRSACAPIRGAATSTSRAGSMSRKPTPRPSTTARPASCATSRISAAATRRAISAPFPRTSAQARATTTR
jgi:hypothetical protein